jgi:hypothetical protein
MANAQQDQERQANRLHNVAPAYRVGNKVYLSLRNIQTNKLSKKLDDRAVKYIVVKVVGPASYRLNIPPRVYNVFYVDLLRPAVDDPLPSQVLDDPQPPAILIDGEEE